MNKKQLEALIVGLKIAQDMGKVKLFGVDFSRGAGDRMVGGDLGAMVEGVLNSLNWLGMAEQSEHPAAIDVPIIYFYNGAVWYKPASPNGGGLGDSTGAVNLTYPDEALNALSFGQSYTSIKSNEVLDDGGTLYPNTTSKTIADLYVEDLFKSANLIITPLATKAGDGSGNGVLYSVKGSNFTVARTSKKSRINEDGYIKQVDIDEASISYLDNYPTIKIEPASTNKILYYKSFENSYWTKTGLSVDTNSGSYYPSPFKDSSGNIVNCARKLVEDTSNGQHYFYNRVITSGLSAGDVYSISAIVKMGERDWFVLSTYEVGSVHSTYQYYNLDIGETGYGDGASNVIMKKLTNDWYLCSYTMTVATGATDLRYYGKMSDQNYNSAAPSYTGDGTSGIYLSYAQLEKEPAATSPISDVTIADGAEMSRASEDNIADYNGDSESGVLFIESRTNNDLITKKVSLSDSTQNNRIFIAYQLPSNTIRAYIVVNGVNVLAVQTNSYDIEVFNKIAVRWKENNFSLWVNGVKIGEELSGNTFDSNVLTKLAFFKAGYNTSNIFTGDIKQLQTLTYLTDEEMVKLTTP